MLETRTFRFGAALVLLLSAGVYANTLSFGAAWDDTRFVFSSGARGGITAAPSLWTSPYLTDVPPSRSPYRPTTATSYALDWTLGGGQARVFHWTNVLLHAGVTGLLMALLVALGVPGAAILLGGAWFGVHPIHVEAVANIAGRAELLTAFFGMLALVLYLRGTGAPGTHHPAPAVSARPAGATLADRPAGAPAATSSAARSSPLLLAVSVLSLALALGAKENAVTLLPILVAVAVVAQGAGSLLRHRWYWIGVGGVLVAYLLARWAVLGTLTTQDVAPFILELPAPTRIATAVANWWEYARLIVAPMDLVVDYGPAVVLPVAPASFPAARGLVVGIGCCAAALAVRRRTPLVALGLVWFALALFPVSNLAVVIAQWMAERFFYLPSVGAAVALAGLLRLAPDRAAWRRSLPVVAAIVLVLLAARTWERNSTWKDTDTVARTLITEHPEAFRSQWLLGSALLSAGETEGGMRALERAIELNPGAMELHLERAGWLLRLGDARAAHDALVALPFGMHPHREAHLARSLVGLGLPRESLEAVDAGLGAFPENPELLALADSLRTSTARDEDRPAASTESSAPPR